MPSFRILTLGALVATWLLVGTPAGDTLRAQASMAPVFEVDPLWPNPLPDNWVTGSTIGLSVDDQDNVWTIHRPFTVEDNFKAADIMVGVDFKHAPEVARHIAKSFSDLHRVRTR